MGLGTDDGDEYVCSPKVHRLMTQIQRRTVLFFYIDCHKGQGDPILGCPA